MNRFKSKKKATKEDLAEARPSLESKSTTSLFRRGKKYQEPEPKPEIDLASALPPTDDFRTSLLMSGLSARFSMLREQDDPKSKLGKASDDSVLFPNRQSRLADFGFTNGTGLGDIAEVESIKAPPFLRRDTTASNESGNGSMMTRSRPLESNVMFGGRQKVYKIAAGSASTKNVDGMSGRALYDDDVPLSSFQKWRQAERDRGVWNGADENEDDKTMSEGTRGTEGASFITRSESPPPQGYNQKRETSSTTSSTPSLGRNSTAATSIISQATPASKDSYIQQATSATSATSTPALERHVTRTRRLYEQGLTQDLQEQQHSVLSRVDTLTRRLGGSRTPEMGGHSPSPTSTVFSDRWAAFGGERRTILSKASAPNLRSMSPPASGSLNGSMELNTRVANDPDPKAGFFSPPLSPPISDSGTGEHLNMFIQAKDHGKATAMNMFQKPNSTYDDSKYAERQRQLQRDRSESAASFRRQDSDIKTPTSPTVAGQVDVPGQQDPAGTTFFDAGLESPIVNEHVANGSPGSNLERPSDMDHPAFRGAFAPLAFAPKADEPQLPTREKTSFHNVGSGAKLADSPTLGPTTGGLSGMVRQHMRIESDVSSIYAPHSESQPSPRRLDDFAGQGKAWEDDGEDRSFPGAKQAMPRLDEDPKSASQNTGGTFLAAASPRSPDEEADFANQLANARRRVREKLTSFVETDPGSFSPPSMAAPLGDLPTPPSRSNPLGILRSKDSRGSLIDRGRDAEPRSTRDRSVNQDTEARLNEQEEAHPSLRAFRQARRELQRRKEAETLGRRPSQTQNGQSPSPPTERQMNGGRRELGRAPSKEGFHSEYRQQASTNVPTPPLRSQSRITRERSGSDNSDESNRSRGRPSPKVREVALPTETQSVSPNASAPRKPMPRSPGLPGTDIRNSPYLPPTRPSQNGTRSPYIDGLRVVPGRSMTEPASAGHYAGHSPVSPQNGRFEAPRSAFPSNGASASGSSTPSLPPSRRPSLATNSSTNTSSSTLTDSMKRVVNKKDISTPTFVMSTSRVPTTSLSQSVNDAREAREARSRSGSIADTGSPPPLPPVNPRRKRDTSRTRTLMNGFMGRRNDEADHGVHSMSTPQLPLDPPSAAPFGQPYIEDRSSAFSISDDEDGKPSRRRLRKASSELKMDVRATGGGSKRGSPPQVAVGPPAGRGAVMRGGPSPNMPGGMF